MATGRALPIGMGPGGSGLKVGPEIEAAGMHIGAPEMGLDAFPAAKRDSAPSPEASTPREAAHTCSIAKAFGKKT